MGSAIGSGGGVAVFFIHLDAERGQQFPAAGGFPGFVTIEVHSLRCGEAFDAHHVDYSQLIGTGAG